MSKLLCWVIFLYFDLIIEGGPHQTDKELMRPNITSLNEQRCEEIYQTTMVEHTNKYRSLKGLKPLRSFRKLQYVALLAAQRCNVSLMSDDIDRATLKMQLFMTDVKPSPLVNISAIECQNNAVSVASEWYDWVNDWAPLNKEKNESYMGCALSIVDSVECNVCYYQNDTSADKLELNIVPAGVEIDLESYNDSFWTQFDDPIVNVSNLITLDRPNITSLDEQRCQEDHQTTMLEQINKYRSLNGLKPLQSSKKLQYVALLAVQRSKTLKIFNTEISYGSDFNTSLIKCTKSAVKFASTWYEFENWTPLDKKENYTYMGCAISIVDSIGHQVCYYQNDIGADKLKLNIMPSEVNIDLESYNDSFWTQFQDPMENRTNLIAQTSAPLDRPNITSLEDQRCQEDYQTTMLEHTNKYRSLYGLKPLQLSKKLQYIALLAAQRCHEGGRMAVESLKMFNTESIYDLTNNTSITECKNNAINKASNWYEWLMYWLLLNKEENYTHIGCAISIVENTGCHVCYYHGDKGADNLELDIVPLEINIDLESYNDSFWTQFQDPMPNIIAKKSDPLNRPNITSLEDQRCQADYQTTMLEHTNKYRSLYGMIPLQVSQKLQYVALQAAQRSYPLNSIAKAVESFLLFSTVVYYGLDSNISSIECKTHAVNRASDWYEYWVPLYKDSEYTYLGCAISIVNSTGYQVCYLQSDKGADNLELNIVPPGVFIDLESYSDSFWTQF